MSRRLSSSELELKYWQNPNQVYESGLKDSHFKLANAHSICLLDCPEPSEDSLNWVCDFPEGYICLLMKDWINRNYDYFEFLTMEMRNTSLQLRGPCYPLIFPSVNEIHGRHRKGMACADCLWRDFASFSVSDLADYDWTFCCSNAMDNS